MENRLSSKKFHADLQATCASLGYTDENGLYQREPDCLGTLNWSNESDEGLIYLLKSNEMAAFPKLKWKIIP